ncbi:MAG: hypothetical protein Q8R30_05865 [bacterium]|nr:hypothetical protein [bacterium]
MRNSLCTILCVLFLTFVTPPSAHGQTQGFHPSIRLGTGLAGQIFGEHSAYDFKVLQVTDATLDYEFCLTPSCRVFMGPYLKFSFFTAPHAAGRIAGGLVTGVSLNDRLAIFAETGLGQATQDIMVNSRFGQTATTYDLTLGLRRHLPGKKNSLLAGITHESNGHAQGLSFFIPESKNKARNNIGLTYLWVGIGF